MTHNRENLEYMSGERNDQHGGPTNEETWGSFPQRKQGPWQGCGGGGSVRDRARRNPIVANSVKDSDINLTQNAIQLLSNMVKERIYNLYARYNSQNIL